jgi:hypothetical protein
VLSVNVNHDSLVIHMSGKTAEELVQQQFPQHPGMQVLPPSPPLSAGDHLGDLSIEATAVRAFV